jgi:hypothetical protein
MRYYFIATLACYGIYGLGYLVGFGDGTLSSVHYFIEHVEGERGDIVLKSTLKSVRTSQIYEITVLVSFLLAAVLLLYPFFKKRFHR